MCGKSYYEWEIPDFQITFQWNYPACYELQKFLSSVKILSSVAFRMVLRVCVSVSELQADNKWKNVAYFSFQITGTKFTFFNDSHRKCFQILISLMLSPLTSLFSDTCSVHHIP